MFKNLSFENLGIKTEMREALRLAKLGNFEGADIDIVQAESLCGKHSFAYLKGMFDSFGIKPGAWRLPMDIADTETGFNKSLEEIAPFMATAEKIGALRALVLLPSGSENFSCEDFCAILPERLSILGAIAAKHSCRIGVQLPEIQQSVKTYKHTYSFSLNQAVDLCRKTSTGNAGIVFDTFIWHSEGSRKEDLQKLGNNDIVYVKLSDAGAKPSDEIRQTNERRLPGETNTVNLTLAMKLLCEIGYKGPVTPVSEERRITALPHEIAVILSGGYLAGLWKKVFTGTQD